MADYSGYCDPISTSFEPDTGPVYWWSSKDFSGVKTTVPKEYLSYLITLVRERNQREFDAGLPITKCVIKYEKGRYHLQGTALSENSRKVEQRFGWENPCPHEWRKHPRADYDFCFKCSETNCKHNKQVKYREAGKEDDWVCAACGGVIEI